MAQTITASINLSKIDKSKLIKGQKGTYLNLVAFVNDEPDQFGNNVAVAQSQTKEERDGGAKTNYLGNGKTSDMQQREVKTESIPMRAEQDDDLPF